MLISAIFFFFFFFLFFFCFLLWGQRWYDVTFPKVAVEQRGSWPCIKKYRPKSVGITDCKAYQTGMDHGMLFCRSVCQPGWCPSSSSSLLLLLDIIIWGDVHEPISHSPPHLASLFQPNLVPVPMIK